MNLGAYVSGANPRLDSAIRLRSGIESFLRQEVGANAKLEETLDSLSQLAGSMTG
jgi:flagellar biosynthesis/type III secretory pathway ATPase